MRNKLIITLLIISVGLNFYMLDQMNKFKKDIDNTFKYSANMVLANIRGLILLTSQPDINWNGSNTKADLYSHTMLIQTYCFITNNLGSLTSPVHREIQGNLAQLGYVIGQYRIIAENISRDRPVSDEDKEKFIILGRALKEAGFTVQFPEDNGINFNDSLNKFLSKVNKKK